MTSPPAYYRPVPPPRPPAPVAAIIGRVIGFSGLTAAIVVAGIWLVVGGLALAAGPTCAECVGGWAPPIAVGVGGSVVAFVAWGIALIAAWRNQLLLLWALLPWVVLGASSIWAIERFAGLFNR